MRLAQSRGRSKTKAKDAERLSVYCRERAPNLTSADYTDGQVELDWTGDFAGSDVVEYKDLSVTGSNFQLVPPGSLGNYGIEYTHNGPSGLSGQETVSAEKASPSATAPSTRAV